MIKDILDNLTKEQRRQLMYGFENSFAQTIDLPDGKFIGVNVANVEDYEILEQKGVWCYGNRNNG